MIRVVQVAKNCATRVALVEEPRLRLLSGSSSVYELVQFAEETGASLESVVRERASAEQLDYEAVYCGDSDWRLLLPIHHPVEPARCQVSGTGLTHLGSAQNRQAMHSGSGIANPAELNDSMKMFRWGMDAGKPAPGAIGIAPEWFYKGNGTILRAHNEVLEVPPYADDGGEEAEVAGIYFIDRSGLPRRIGMATGNEFADHQFEKKNYLNLAGSKLRPCSLGPELVVGPLFESVPGRVTIRRGNQVVWSQGILTGEKEMCHSLANIEHHHFKFESHRRPGDIHVHYFGACSLSFGAGVALADGDLMEIAFEGFGRPLSNPLQIAEREQPPISAIPI